MIKLFKQLVIQSRVSAIIFSISIGCILDVVDYLLFRDEVSAPLVVLTIVSSGLIGLVLHEFLKAREKIKESKT